jgi:hypothetical protein
MEVPLFDRIDDLVHALCPERLGQLHTRSHRRGVKVWFDADKSPREHYEAQVLARRHVDGTDGVALEIGFHAEHTTPKLNQAAIDRALAKENAWRPQLGDEAQAAVFFDAPDWRRISEAWIEPDLDDPELAFEVASRLVDYLTALQPHVGAATKET